MYTDYTPGIKKIVSSDSYILECIHYVFSPVPTVLLVSPVCPAPREHIKCLLKSIPFKVEWVTVEEGDLVLEEIKGFVMCIFWWLVACMCSGSRWRQWRSNYKFTVLSCMAPHIHSDIRQCTQIFQLEISWSKDCCSCMYTLKCLSWFRRSIKIHFMFFDTLSQCDNCTLYLHATTLEFIFAVPTIVKLSDSVSTTQVNVRMAWPLTNN